MPWELIKIALVVWTIASLAGLALTVYLDHRALRREEE